MTTQAELKKTLDQRRAEHAWKAVQRIAQQHVTVTKGKPVPDKDGKAFGGNAKKLPTRIMASGLGQALAFLHGKELAKELQIALGDWVLDKRRNPHSNKAPPAPDALLQAVIQGSSGSLRVMTDEVLAYLSWLNRFADGAGLTEKVD